MASTVTFNSVQYSVPAYLDTGWAQGTGNLSQYLTAIASGCLQLSGGNFTLTADVNFGGSFGLKSLYYQTRASNPSSEGLVRLAHSDTIAWRNNVNNDNLVMEVDASDNLLWNRTHKVLLSGAVVNADINASAAIAYSKLALTGSIVNADVNASAAIAYSKLSLAASVVNADIASAAAIALNKLAALSASIVPVSDASGFIVSSSTTATELGFVHGVTSAIQTQINTKSPSASPTFTGTIGTPLTGSSIVGTDASGNLIASAAFGTANSRANGTITGTIAADDAAAGKVGEYSSSTVSAVSVTTSNTIQDATSITLSAGDWDISVQGEIAFNTNTSLTDFLVFIGTAAGNNATGLVTGVNMAQLSGTTFTNFTLCLGISPWRVSISGSTQYFLKVRGVYTNSAPFFYGIIRARRIR